MNKTIYCLSGLAADEKILKKINIPGYHLTCLPWLPIDKDDTMKTYALKMVSQIHEEKPIVMGLSFGGMLATEIALTKRPRQTIIISSVKGKHEFPKVHKLLVAIMKSDFFPYGLFKTPSSIMYKKFGAHTKEEKKLLAGYVRTADTSFFKRCVQLIINWQNTTNPPDVIHIHGTDDSILPIKFIHADYLISQGTHMMIWNRAKKISGIIETVLQNSK